MRAPRPRVPKTCHRSGRQRTAPDPSAANPDRTMTWETMPLGEFVTLKRGYDLPSSRRTAGSVPVVSSSGITGRHNTAKVKGPGVITGRYGTLGEVFYIADDFWPLNTSLYVQDFKGNDPRFSAYFLQSVLRRTSSDKAAVPGVNRNHLHALEIRVTRNAAEQERIASILGAYDDLIENNRRRIQLLEHAARVIHKEWFVNLRFPGHEHVKVKDGVAMGWKRKKIADVCKTVGGGTPSTKVPDYWEGDITWIVPTDVTRNDCLVLLDSARKITDKGLSESSSQLVPAKTILMTSRASVGFFALMDVEVCTNQGFINVIPYDEGMRMYLLFNLICRIPEIRSNAKGTTYPEISKRRFGQMDVTIPSKPLVTEFERLAGEIIRQVRCLKQENFGLAQARELLLPRLMNGELGV